MLTRKQLELLIFIDKFIRGSGTSPSFEEMKEALGLRSKSGIHRLILALEERGFLQRRVNRARALEVIRVPTISPETLPEDDDGEPGFEPNVIRGSFTSRLAGVIAGPDAAAVQIPMYGRIAAGLPIEALRDDGAHIAVPLAWVAGGEHFALEVHGDSMIEAGILNGDIVVIRRCDTAQTGEIVVALIDETEVTLKRLRRRANSIALEPANANHETRIFPADRVRVQGRLVALTRKYEAR